MAGKVDYMSLQPSLANPTVSSNAKASMNTTYIKPLSPRAQIQWGGVELRSRAGACCVRRKGPRSKRVTDAQDRIISVGRNVKLEDKDGEHIQSRRDFFTGRFLLGRKKGCRPRRRTGAYPRRGMRCLPFGCGNCGSAIPQPFLSARAWPRGYRTNRGSGPWRDSVEGRPACRSWIFRR